MSKQEYCPECGYIKQQCICNDDDSRICNAGSPYNNGGPCPAAAGCAGCRSKRTELTKLQEYAAKQLEQLRKPELMGRKYKENE